MGGTGVVRHDMERKGARRPTRRVTGRVGWCQAAMGWGVYSGDGPDAWTSCQRNNSKLKKNQSTPNLNRFKSDLLRFQKFEIKYGEVGFELRNNSTYWNISKFGKELELKSRQVKLSLNSIEIYFKILGALINLGNFAKELLITTRFRKN
jgi:hypothetical protein